MELGLDECAVFYVKWEQSQASETSNQWMKI